MGAPPAWPDPREFHFTPQEVEALIAVAWYGDAAEAAEHLGLAPRTVENYLASVRDKLGFDNTLRVVTWAIWSGIVPAPPWVPEQNTGE